MFLAGHRMPAMGVFTRFRRAFVFRPMIVRMRVRMRMTVNHVAMPMLVIMTMAVGVLMVWHLPPPFTFTLLIYETSTPLSNRDDGANAESRCTANILHFY